MVIVMSTNHTLSILTGRRGERTAQLGHTAVLINGLNHCRRSTVSQIILRRIRMLRLAHQHIINIHRRRLVATSVGRLTGANYGTARQLEISLERSSTGRLNKTNARHTDLVKPRMANLLSYPFGTLNLINQSVTTIGVTQSHNIQGTHRLNGVLRLYRRCPHRWGHFRRSAHRSNQ